jgi:biopolymer transport protein TolR
MAGGIQDSDEDEITGINVTPLVDVMLVLLIIFMVTANYINQRSIEVKLPKAETGATTSETKNVSLTLDQAGTVYVDGVITDWAMVGKKIAEALAKNGSTLQAIITADIRTSHGDVVKLIDTVRKNGINDFALNVDSAPSSSNP